MAALAAHWGCRVIAFEPQRHLRAFWRTTSALNRWGDRVVWVPAAVGERTGSTARLARPVGDWGQVHAGTQQSNAAAAASRDNFLPDDASIDDVAVVRVSDVVQAAAAIKIDVEGSEAAAMRSCEHLLLAASLQLAAIEFQGSTDADYSEGLFAKLAEGGMSSYIFQEEYFRFASHLLALPLFSCTPRSFLRSCDFPTNSCLPLPFPALCRSIRSSSPRLQAFPIMLVSQFQGLSRAKPFDDLLFTRQPLPAAWLWDMKLTDQAHRDALQALQHASPHEQAVAASFLSRWARNLGDMEYFAHTGDTVCRIHVNVGQLLRAANDCYILWSVTRNLQHAVYAITVQRASGRWEQAENTLAELVVVLRSSLHVRTAVPLRVLAQVGVPGSVLTLLPPHFNAAPAVSLMPSDAAATVRGMALALVHCSNSAVASIALALARKSAMLVCIDHQDVCPSWCRESFGGIVDGQCSCEKSVAAASTGIGGGVGMLLDACKVDGDDGCAFDQVASVHADAAAIGLPAVVYPDAYQGKHPLLSRAFVVTHAPLHSPDSPLTFDRSLRVLSFDIIRALRASVPAHHIAGWGPSIPAHASSAEMHLMIAHARTQHGAAAPSSPIVLVLNAATATPSVAADIAAAAAQGAHVVLGNLLPDTARLWIDALLKLGAQSARLFWCNLVPHGPEDALPYHEPRSDSGCAARLQAAAVAADIVFDARPAGGSLVEVLQHCVWGALPAVASPIGGASPHYFERVMHVASALVGFAAPVQLSGAQRNWF